VSTPLELATALLDGRLSIGTNSVRAAAWITRTALEDCLEDLLQAKGCQRGRASMRSVLSCVEVLYAGDAACVSLECEYAWQGPSHACQYQAYELPPTRAEVAALLAIVERLASL